MGKNRLIEVKKKKIIILYESKSGNLNCLCAVCSFVPDKELSNKVSDKPLRVCRWAVCFVVVLEKE